VRTVAVLLLALFGPAHPADCAAPAGPPDRERVVALGDSIGPEISPAEREAYALFPDIVGFESARLERAGDAYRVHLRVRAGSESRTRTRRLSAEAFELTRFHVALVDSHRALDAAGPAGAGLEPEALRRIALRYAARGRYDVAGALAEDLAARSPAGPDEQWGAEVAPRMRHLEKDRRVLFRAGALSDRSGRGDLLLFSGYYGLWLGIATPVALDATDPQAFAAGLLLGGPGALYLAHAATKDADIGEGRATMIALGGHLGTWQGLGWASLAFDETDREGRDVIAAGEVAGLAGIAGSILLTRRVHFSEGHAEITSSGMSWGAWFGLVAAVLMGDEGDPSSDEGENILRDMLIGSDLGVVGAGIAARDVRASRSRVRLVNLAGVLGAVVGGGVDLFFEIDDEKAAIAIAGLGSIAGLAAGAIATRNVDRGKDLSETESTREGRERGLLATLDPGIEVRPTRHGRTAIPALALRARF
jgi:hypothetical protein